MSGNSLSYLGWSGFKFSFPGSAPLFIDPPNDSSLPRDTDISLLISHGHPEHISGALGYLRDSSRQGAANVLAPPRMCAYLKRRSRHPHDQFQPCLPGTAHNLDGVIVDAFQCHHMPLLPPEKGATVERVKQLIGNVKLAVGIALDVVRGPLAGPMLGFRLSPPQGSKILFLGEGLHRNIKRENIAEIGANYNSDIVITAIEPEDHQVLPDLISATQTAIAIPYEAHMPWREGFKMPLADIDGLSATLAGIGMVVIQADKGSTTPLPDKD